MSQPSWAARFMLPNPDGGPPLINEHEVAILLRSSRAVQYRDLQLVRMFFDAWVRFTVVGPELGHLVLRPVLPGNASTTSATTSGW